MVEISKVSERRKLREEVRLIKSRKRMRQEGMSVSLSGEDLEKMECFRYPRVYTAVSGTMEAD